MSTINEYISKLDDLAANYDVHVRDIVLKHKGGLLSKVKLRLFRTSLDAEGKFLGYYQWEFYKDEKKDMGLPSNRITLRHTGKFYASMFIDYKDKHVIVDATDSKTSALEHMFGKAILQLSEEELTMFTDTTLEPELYKKIEDLGDLDIGII